VYFIGESFRNLKWFFEITGSKNEPCRYLQVDKKIHCINGEIPRTNQTQCDEARPTDELFLKVKGDIKYCMN
jgi:hypothetical protein